MTGIVILADEEDRLAIGVAAALRRTRRPVLALTPTQLTLGCRWTHRVSGRTSGTRLQLRADGREVVPLAVLNRLTASRFYAAALWGSPTDAAYAEAEFQALVASWLANPGCRVIGPAPSGLLSQQRGLFEWLAAARGAGLPVQAVALANDARAVAHGGRVLLDPFAPGRPLTRGEMFVVGRNPVLLAAPLTDLRSAYVVGQEVIDAPERVLVAPVRRLAEQTRSTLLECRFGRTAAGCWVVCGATDSPQDGSASLIEALAAHLASAAQAAA